MPYRLIGRTAVFGTVSQGSSPCGATINESRAKARLFLCVNVRHATLLGNRADPTWPCTPQGNAA